MNKIETWAAANRTAIEQYVKDRNYLELIQFFACGTNLSNVKLAALFRCDRRSLRRYLAGERQVPMEIVGIMLRNMGISYAELTMKDKMAAPDCNPEGSLIWYGGNELLANTLYFYRTLEWKISRFEMACELNIREDALWEYEHGKRRIPSAIVEQIVRKFPITVMELFPTIISYDGGKTYLQLDTRYDLTLGGKLYNIFEDVMYVDPNGEEASFYMPEWPAWRYDAYTKPMLKYMPNELTMDEYYNTDDLYFVKGDDWDEIYEPGEFCGQKLPPSYEHIRKYLMPGARRRKNATFNYQILSCILSEPYTVSITLYRKPAKFDLSDYVFSDSVWYQMLQDPEYFKRGKLCSHNHTNLVADCYLSWPDGQYVNILELYMDQRRNQAYPQVRGIGAGNRLYY